jgi:hypothetical protein
MSIRRALVLTLITAALCVPTLAEAQLGGMIRRKVRDAVSGGRDSTPAATSSPTEARGGGRSSAVVVTDDVITQFMTAMAPRLAYGDRWIVWKRAADAREAWFTCVQKQTDGATPRMPTTDAERARYERVMGEVNRVTTKLAGGGDREFSRMMQDTMKVAQANMMLYLFPFVSSRCGAMPAGGGDRPAAPGPLTLPAGMTANQFGLLRERLALALAYPSQSTGRFALSPEEQAVVTARSRDLARFATAAKDKSIRFSTWEDLTRATEVEDDQDR